MLELDNKQQIHVPMLYECSLPIGHRLVLGYSLYQQKYRTDPSDVSFHNHTGLSRATIKTIRQELEADNWQNKYLEYTRPATNKYGYQYFSCFIHQPGEKQTVASIALWSFLHHMGQNNFKCLFNYAYFGTVLGFSNGTAQNCLESLQADNWLKYNVTGTGRRQRLNFTRYKLNETHFLCLKDKGTKISDENYSSNDLIEAPLRPKENNATINTVTEDENMTIDFFIDTAEDRYAKYGDRWENQKCQLRKAFARRSDVEKSHWMDLREKLDAFFLTPLPTDN